jgi:hypothetical protein
MRARLRGRAWRFVVRMRIAAADILPAGALL